MQRRAAEFTHIIVGVIYNIVAGGDNRLNQSVGEAVHQRDVEYQLWNHERVVEIDGVAAGALQVGVSLSHIIGVADNGRVEVADARAGDARCIVELQCVGVVELVAYAECRHHVVESAVERRLRAIGIGGTHSCKLIAQSGTGTPACAVVGILAIERTHVGGVVEVGGVV